MSDERDTIGDMLESSDGGIESLEKTLVRTSHTITNNPNATLAKYVVLRLGEVIACLRVQHNILVQLEYELGELRRARK